ncbi:hypothetical protein B0T16DRAFT_186228 [Cercophora newfieldiana]|uniref:Uncharacterized protein n=1 Tax=Cercophora newfieldiana TaxID=92897 RepID=A0AA39Y0A0_9PEZI|nr:hypothetical protein B0T16DRAFT_186228 [Cercophora newfieldiana]
MRGDVRRCLHVSHWITVKQEQPSMADGSCRRCAFLSGVYPSLPSNLTPGRSLPRIVSSVRQLSFVFFRSGVYAEMQCPHAANNSQSTLQRSSVIGQKGPTRIWTPRLPRVNSITQTPASSSPCLALGFQECGMPNHHIDLDQGRGIVGLKKHPPPRCAPALAQGSAEHPMSSQPHAAKSGDRLGSPTRSTRSDRTSSEALRLVGRGQQSDSHMRYAL